MTETFLTVRYSETDRMGIVHHSRYYPWFEIARSDFIKQIGIKYSELEEKGILMPLVETGSRYFGSCTYEDEIVIETRLVKLWPAKCEFSYNVYKLPERKLINIGKTVLGFVDTNMVPVNMKKVHPEYYNKLEGLIDKL